MNIVSQFLRTALSFFSLPI
ncbi:UNVERIFIED_CONTAM: hypothetical protein NCL1_30481 [Trichonephila clavipes]